MKLSIVAEGGGMRGAYAAGAIYALYSYFGLKKVDYATGSSASIGTLAYYTSGQTNIGMHIWPKFAPEKKFMSLRNIFAGHPILNVDYMIDEVFKKYIPLDKNKIKNSKTKFIVPLTNADNGQAEYFDNKTKMDFFEILKAAMAAPFAYGKEIKINGSYYIDGSFSDPLPIDISPITDSRKIIILTKRECDVENFKAEKILSYIMKWKLKPHLHRAIKDSYAVYKEKIEKIKALERGGDFVIIPSQKMSRFDNRRKTILESIGRGYKNTISNNKLAEFVTNLKDSNKKYYFSD